MEETGAGWPSAVVPPDEVMVARESSSSVLVDDSVVVEMGSTVVSKLSLVVDGPISAVDGAVWSAIPSGIAKEDECLG